MLIKRTTGAIVCLLSPLKCIKFKTVVGVVVLVVLVVVIKKVIKIVVVFLVLFFVIGVSSTISIVDNALVGVGIAVIVGVPVMVHTARSFRSLWCRFFLRIGLSRIDAAVAAVSTAVLTTTLSLLDDRTAVYEQLVRRYMSVGLVGGVGKESVLHLRLVWLSVLRCLWSIWVFRTTKSMANLVSCVVIRSDTPAAGGCVQFQEPSSRFPVVNVFNDFSSDALPMRSGWCCLVSLMIHPDHHTEAAIADMVMADFVTTTNDIKL